MIVELLNRFEPEPDGLLREIFRHVDDEMLKEIAAADYGQDVERHLAALRPIRDTCIFPPDLIWYPMEALELIRWSQPENPDWKPGRTGEFEHWMRAFSCAAILRATCEPWNYRGDCAFVKTTIHMILRLRMLPVDLTRLAASFLSWLMVQVGPEGTDRAVCAYGIGQLWFALHLAPAVPDEDLVFLAKWIARRAEELYLRPGSGRDKYLYRLGVGNPPPSAWAHLGVAFSDLDLSGRSSELQEWGGLIGQELAE